MTTKNNPTRTTSDHKLVITRELNAPRERVWKAWTEPAQAKQWMGLIGGMTVESVKMDLRVGGKFRLQTKKPDGEFFTAAGTYLEVKPPERLVYTWDWEKDGSEPEFGELEGKETQLTIELHAKGERTELTLTHENFASVERRDRHVEGWQIWIGKFATFVESK